MIKTITLPKTEKGNDPADHVDDIKYENKIIELLASDKQANSLSWLDDFMISDEEADMISDPKFIVDDLIVGGHLIAVVAKPNGGKTTIFLHLSGEMVSNGYEVVYINSDISASDSKSFRAKANRLGVKALFPDMKQGKSMEDVVTNLKKLNASNHSLHNHVFVFDTFKKMANVINKASNKQVLQLLRGLTAKGATIILLAHTNKYEDAEGKPIFEGTGDLRSDVDEMIYLIPEKHSDSSMTVSVEPDKTRASIKKMTFKITPQREVYKLDEYVDVIQANLDSKRLDDDQDAISAIKEAITAKKIKQKEIITYCKDQYISARKVREVLKRYRDNKLMHLWNEQRGLDRNTIYYSLV